MVSIIKFKTKPNAFVLADLDFLDKMFVEVRVSCGACVKSLHFILAQSGNSIITNVCPLKFSWKKHNWNTVTLLEKRSDKSRLSLSILNCVDWLLMSQMGLLMMYWYEVAYQPSTAQLLSHLGTVFLISVDNYLLLLNHSGDHRGN